MNSIPQRTVERFFRYSQFLHSKLETGSVFVFSHELAAAVGVSPEQVRRDLMNFTVSGDAGFENRKALVRAGQAFLIVFQP